MPKMPSMIATAVKTATSGLAFDADFGHRFCSIVTIQFFIGQPTGCCLYSCGDHTGHLGHRLCLVARLHGILPTKGLAKSRQENLSECPVTMKCQDLQFG